ncbi:hypothetical protein [Brevibacillus nitrificans]|nr:hypothetical protein [Brevibacillus nitrificans]
MEKPVSILRSRLRPTGCGCWPLRLETVFSCELVAAYVLLQNGGTS